MIWITSLFIINRCSNMSLRFRPFRTFFGQFPTRQLSIFPTRRWSIFPTRQWSIFPTRRFSITTRSECESRPSDKPLFPGSRSSWTEKLEFLGSEAYEGIPVYRVTDRDGRVIDPSQDPQLGEEEITKMYKGVLIYCLNP